MTTHWEYGQWSERATDWERERELTLYDWRTIKTSTGHCSQLQTAPPQAIHAPSDAYCSQKARAFSKPQSAVWLWTQFPGVRVLRGFIGPLGTELCLQGIGLLQWWALPRKLGWICKVFGEWNLNRRFVWGTYLVANRIFSTTTVYSLLSAYIYYSLCIHYSAFILIKSWKEKHIFHIRNGSLFARLFFHFFSFAQYSFNN